MKMNKKILLLGSFLMGISISSCLNPYSSGSECPNAKLEGRPCKNVIDNILYSVEKEKKEHKKKTYNTKEGYPEICDSTGKCYKYLEIEIENKNVNKIEEGEENW